MKVRNTSQVKTLSSKPLWPSPRPRPSCGVLEDLRSQGQTSRTTRQRLCGLTRHTLLQSIDTGTGNINCPLIPLIIFIDYSISHAITSQPAMLHCCHTASNTHGQQPENPSSQPDITVICGLGLQRLRGSKKLCGSVSSLVTQSAHH